MSPDGRWNLALVTDGPKLVDQLDVAQASAAVKYPGGRAREQMREASVAAVTLIRSGAIGKPEGRFDIRLAGRARSFECELSVSIAALRGAV